MQHSKIEHDLKRLDAPTAPHNLRARCLATVPKAARDHSRTQTRAHHNTAWRMQRFALAGGLLAVTAVGSAFWTTRPLSNPGKIVSSSVAFAQTIKAMQNLDSFHIKGKSLKSETKAGWHSKEWTQTEAWFDSQLGAYGVVTNSPYGSELLPANFAKTTYSLSLPDGTSYARGNSQVVVEKNASSWQRLKQQASTLLLGDVATTSAGAAKSRYFNTGGDLKLQSTQTASWEGKEVKLFLLKGQASEDNRGAPTILKKIYVNTDTDLVVATQEFALFEGAEPQLVSQLEVDYERPDPALFDPVKFEEGTTRVPRSDPYVHP
ncbi:hypothetical protein IAD21_03259 [Abditibacteriota bacterium]|nr:hypothetical protein IAD21_03259 [Abditibacteriota bacterium]